MKRVSMVLGIVAGIIGLGGAFQAYQNVAFFSEKIMAGVDPEIVNLAGGEQGYAALISQMSRNRITPAIIMLVLCVVGAVLGIAGGILAGKNRKAAGVLMAAGGVLSVVSDFGSIIIPLMLMGSIFVLLGDDPDFQQHKISRGVATAAKLLGFTGGIAVFLAAAQSLYINAMDQYYVDKALADYYSVELTLIAALGGAAAFAGGLLVKKKRVLAGVLMLIGAAASLAIFYETKTLPIILLFLGGVFAFISGSKPSPESVEADAELPAAFGEAMERQE